MFPVMPSCDSNFVLSCLVFFFFIVRFMSPLQDGMDKAGASVPLLVLPAHQTEALLYEGGSLDDQMRGRPQPHLKASTWTENKKQWLSVLSEDRNIC